MFTALHCRGLSFSARAENETKEHATQKEGMARLGLYKAEILLKPTINEVDFRLHVFIFYIPNLALISLLSPWWLNYPRRQMMNLGCEMRNEK